jgi:hypothetical protein
MYNFSDGADGLMSIIYHISLVLFGSFFLVNLILAVIMQSFIKIQSDDLTEEEQQLEDKKEKEVAEKYDPGAEKRKKEAEQA